MPSTALRKGDVVLVEAGDEIPADGEVIEGSRRWTRAPITGESAPVIRETGGDRSAVTGGTRVLSDWLVIRVTANPGEAFLDRMIAMVEGRQAAEDAERDRADDPAGRLDDHVPAGLRDAAAVLACSASSVAGHGTPVTITVLVALLVCLIPTTIGGLLWPSASPGMDRMMQANVIATSGRAVEAAGDVDVLLLDKTGTITLGNRQAVEFIPVDGVDARQLAEAAQLASLADETPEGRSIVVLAKDQYGMRGRSVAARTRCRTAPRSCRSRAQTRMSGVDFDGPDIRKGARDGDHRVRGGARRPDSAELDGHASTDLPAGRHAAGRVAERHARAGRDLSEGHRQGRHQGAFRRNCGRWASKR